MTVEDAEGQQREGQNELILPFDDPIQRRVFVKRVFAILAILLTVSFGHVLIASLYA